MRLAVPRWCDGKCPNGDVNLITGEDGLARKGGSGPISSSGSFLMGAGGRHLLQKLCSCQDNFFPFECSRWCTRECGIDSYRPLFEEARAIKGVLLEACSRSEYSFGCFTCCRDYLPDFFCSGSFSSSPLSTQSDVWCEQWVWQIIDC